MILLLAAFLIYYDLKNGSLDYTVSCPRNKKHFNNLYLNYSFIILKNIVLF